MLAKSECYPIAENLGDFTNNGCAMPLLDRRLELTVIIGSHEILRVLLSRVPEIIEMNFILKNQDK